MRRTVTDTLPTIIEGWLTQGGTVLRRSTTLVVTALVTGALNAPSSAASDTAQTCQGRPATIVGTGQAIQGTPGDDVIVTGTSQRTYAVAGNDLVCVSPTAVLVVAGDGDDVVDASQAELTTSATYLGAGLDRYLGGPGYNVVFADGTDDTVTDADRAYLTVTAPVTGAPGTYTGGAIGVWSADQDGFYDVQHADLDGPALDAALDLLDREGGPPARLARYAANTGALTEGLAHAGLLPCLPAALQGPVVVNVHAPAGPAWDLHAFVEALKRRGVLISNFRCTEAPSFRVGCIGAVGPDDMRRAAAAMADAMKELGHQPRRAA